MLRGAVVIAVVTLGCQASQPPGSGAIVAPPSEWTWIEFSDAFCANGSRTGLAINPRADAKDVVVYLMGGGACWDHASCYVVKSAWNVELGYGAANFLRESFRSATVFDRASPDNPFREASFVFVPYCTGDLHVGTTDQQYVPWQTTRHVGARNLDAFLARLKPTFAGAERVFVIGSSAGGYGAQMNAGRFAAAFAPTPVHVLADSAPLVAPAGTRWSDWTRAWAPMSPEGCPACADGPAPWVDAARRALGGGRLGLVSSEEDGLLTVFTGLSGSEFRDATRALVDGKFRAAGAAAFVVPGSRHVFLTDVRGVVAADTRLADWLAAFRDGSSAFTTP